MVQVCRIYTYLLTYLFTVHVLYRFQPRTTRTQLGPRESKHGKGSASLRAAAMTQSACRAAANFPVREKHALAHMPLPLPSAIPIQTESQCASILAWVHHLISAHIDTMLSLIRQR